MADDHNALLARADQYARDLDEYYEDSVICNNARECLDDLAAELRALTSRHHTALGIIRRFQDGWQPSEAGNTVWYLEPGIDDAVPETDDLGIQPMTPEERVVLGQAKDPHP